MENECPQCGCNMILIATDENGSHYECPNCDYTYCDSSMRIEEGEEEPEDTDF